MLLGEEPTGPPKIKSICAQLVAVSMRHHRGVVTELGDCHPDALQPLVAAHDLMEAKESGRPSAVMRQDTVERPNQNFDIPKLLIQYI